MKMLCDFEDECENSYHSYMFLYFAELPALGMPLSHHAFSSYRFYQKEEFPRQAEVEVRDRRIREKVGVKTERLYAETDRGYMNEMNFDRQGRMISIESKFQSEEEGKIEWIAFEADYRTWHPEGDIPARILKVDNISNKDIKDPDVYEKLELKFDREGREISFALFKEDGSWVHEKKYNDKGQFSRSQLGAEGWYNNRKEMYEMLYDEAGRPVLFLNRRFNLQEECGYTYDAEGRKIRLIKVSLEGDENWEGYYMPDGSPKPLQSAAFRLVRVENGWEAVRGAKVVHEDHYRYDGDRLIAVDRSLKGGKNSYSRLEFYYDNEGRILRELHRRKPNYLDTVHLYEYDEAGRKARFVYIEGRFSDEIDWNRKVIEPEDVVSLKKARQEHDHSMKYHPDGYLHSVHFENRQSGKLWLSVEDFYHPDGRPDRICWKRNRKKGVIPWEARYQYDQDKLLAGVKVRDGDEEWIVRVEREFW